MGKGLEGKMCEEQLRCLGLFGPELSRLGIGVPCGSPTAPRGPTAAHRKHREWCGAVCQGRVKWV